MTLPLDAPAAVRDGEELDVAALGRYLASAMGVDDVPAIRQFRHGHSNLTYLVVLDGGEFVLRRPPFGNQVRTAHDMTREFRVLSALAPVFPPAPAPRLLCEDDGVLGVPFYLMERRHGVVLRGPAGPDTVLPEPTAGALCAAFVDTLAGLHAIDPSRVGLGGFGRPAGYAARQVAGWTERYAAAETESVPAMNEVSRRLADVVPADGRGAIIHNDFKFDNVMLAGDDLSRIVAVLDWEMATVGDPLMDLGTALAYWIEAGDPAPLRAVAMGPTAAAGMWTRAEIVRRYAERSGLAVERPGFYRAFGLFKLAVIVQQIYARYARGLTRDPRFATMNRMVAILADEALRELAAEV